MIKFMTLVALIISLSGCTSLRRSEDSGYAYADNDTQSNVKQFYTDQKVQERNKAKESLGYSSSRSLNEKEQSRLNQRLYLQRLEDKLISERERRQYYHYKPMMNSDAQRIQFLKYPTVEARERYANSRNLVNNFNEFDDGTIEMIESNDIAVGMNQQAVRESWGDPERVDVAGNEVYGNQAWLYTKMVPSEDGYRKEQRMIYFESRRVVGWESF